MTKKENELFLVPVIGEQFSKIDKLSRWLLSSKARGQGQSLNNLCTTECRYISSINVYFYLDK